MPDTPGWNNYNVGVFLGPDFRSTFLMELLLFVIMQPEPPKLQNFEGQFTSEDLDEIDAVAGMIDANIMETTPSINIGDEMGLTLGDHIFEAHEAINKALEEKKVKGIRADRDHQKALIHYPHDLLEYQGEQKLVPVIVGPKVMVFTSPMRVHTAGVDESALVAVKEGDKWQAKMFDYKATYDEDYAEGDHVAEQIDNWLKAISAEKS